MPLPRYRLLAACGGLFISVMLMPIRNEVNTAFWDTLMDASHVPIFAWLTWLLYASNPAGLVVRRHALLLAIATALIAAIGIEIAQRLTGRHGDIDDVEKGAAGILAAALLLAGQPGAGILTGITALALTLTAPLAASRAMLWRSAHFPLLADFESDAEMPLWLDSDHDTLTSGSPRRRVEQHATQGRYSLEVRTRSENWPGVRLLCADQDWATRDAFAFDLHNASGPFTLSLRFDDAHSSDQSNRANLAIPIAAGPNRIRIPLREIAAQPPARPLDLRGIRRVVFFEDHPETGRTYFLDHVRLE